MSKTKYIITGEGTPVIFSEQFNHSEFQHHIPKSAGFVQFGYEYDNDGIIQVTASCFGESVSLGIKSHKDDAAIIERWILGINPY